MITKSRFISALLAFLFASSLMFSGAASAEDCEKGEVYDPIGIDYND